MLTVKRLKELLDYNPETGEFTWKVDRQGGATAGSVAGTHSCGYIRITVDGKLHYAHRLAWLYAHGYFPEHQIDHKNGIRDDNSLTNLREVSRTCNSQNCKRRSDNTSGFPGVSWHKQKQKWRADAMLHRKQIHLGYHSTAVEAALARLEWELTTEGWTCNHQGILITKIKEENPSRELLNKFPAAMRALNDF